MLSDREILSTFEMVRNENLDVRTVTLGISLFDCASDNIDTFLNNVRKKITNLAGDLVETCNIVGDKYGIPIVNKRISVSPIAVAGAPFSSDEFVKIAHILDRASQEVNVDFIGGFSALVEKGFTKGAIEAAKVPGIELITLDQLFAL